MTTSRIARWFGESFNGRAKERQIECPTCGGKGEYDSYTSYNRTGGTIRVFCRKCNGTGRATEWYWDD
jgi:DnaJ-class molecular chaperone